MMQSCFGYHFMLVLEKQVCEFDLWWLVGGWMPPLLVEVGRERGSYWCEFSRKKSESLKFFSSLYKMLGKNLKLSIFSGKLTQTTPQIKFLDLNHEFEIYKQTEFENYFSYGSISYGRQSFRRQSYGRHSFGRHVTWSTHHIVDKSFSRQIISSTNHSSTWSFCQQDVFKHASAWILWFDVSIDVSIFSILDFSNSQVYSFRFLTRQILLRGRIITILMHIHICQVNSNTLN